MADVLMLMILMLGGMIAKTFKMLWTIWKWLCIMLVWMTIVPILDAIMMSLYICGIILSCALKKKTPHLKGWKWLIFYPSWK